MSHLLKPSPVGIALFWVVLPLILYVPTVTGQVTNRDNLGTEFYVAFFPNEGGETFRESLNTDDLYLTSRVPATGEVDVPALGFYQTFTTIPGQITTIVLPNGNNNSQSVLLSEDDDETVVHGMAVHIKSDTPIAVFGMNHKKWSSDAFMALPVNVLGTEYRTINFPTSEPLGDGDTPGEFVIVAVQDSTNVTITPHDVTSRNTPANVQVNVRMNTGDVYLVQGNPGRVGNDLTGTHIESDHPIAVLSGHKRTEIPAGAGNIHGSSSRDLLVEQLPPVSAWGDSALVVPYATSQKPDLVRVVCAEDGTQITVNGSPVPGTYNAGDFYEITQLPGVTSIQASKPIEVGQYMHTSWGDLYNPPPLAYGDPALALVFPVEQFDTSYTILSIIDAEAFTGNFVNIVADASSIHQMMLDGQPMNPNEFQPIPNSRFDYAQHTLSQGTHNISGPKPFGVTVYALGPVDSYAYTGGSSLKTITPLKTVGLTIDFGDRVLGGAPAYAGTFDTTVVLTNVSEDTVNIYSFPKRISDTDRFNVDSVSLPGGPRMPVSKGLPLAIAPLSTDSFTIEFNPHEPNRRMHTQITANTDHLRAYVVDVYGRGVLDNMGIFSDTDKVDKVDTIDFGTFTKTDGVSDSEVYIGNAGSATLELTSITGPSTAMFAQPGVYYGGTAKTPPYTNPILSIGEPPSGAARVEVQFLPTGKANSTYVDSIVISSQTSSRTVVLIGRVETINPLALSVQSVSWDTTLVCDDSSFAIPVTNPNDLPVTVTSATIIGDGSPASDPTSFAIGTQTPLVIAPGTTGTVQVHFLPNSRGAKTADVVLTYNLPKNAKPDTIPLSGTGNKLTMELMAAQNLHEYDLDPSFLVPIYAKTDLTPFSPDGYEIHVFYDSVNLKLVDIVTKGTLTPPGYPTLFPSSPPGRDTVYFAQAGSESNSLATAIVGGGPTATPPPYGLPLVLLRFQPVLGGADPYTFTKGFPIHYDITFTDSKISSGCADRVFDSGFVQVDPACDTQYLITQPQVPMAMMLGLPQPNPAQANVKVSYDVSQITTGAIAGAVRSADQTVSVTIDVTDMQGNVVRTIVRDAKEPGYYTATLDSENLPNGVYLLRMSAPGYQSARKIVIQR